MDRDDFWSGVRLVVTGLADASKQASYSLGLGAGSLGGALLLLNRWGVNGIEATLISMSAFFIAARFGKAIDDYLERAALRAKVDNQLKLKRSIQRSEQIYSQQVLLRSSDYGLFEELERLLEYRLRQIVVEESQDKREQMSRFLEQNAHALILRIRADGAKSPHNSRACYELEDYLESRLRRLIAEESETRRRQIWEQMEQDIYSLLRMLRWSP